MALLSISIRPRARTSRFDRSSPFTVLGSPGGGHRRSDAKLKIRSDPSFPLRLRGEFWFGVRNTIVLVAVLVLEKLSNPIQESWMVGMTTKRPAADETGGTKRTYLADPINLHCASRTRTIWLRLCRSATSVVNPILSPYEIVCFSRCRVNESESFGIAAFGLDSL
jgi:hypothetical protein